MNAVAEAGLQCAHGSPHACRCGDRQTTRFDFFWIKKFVATCKSPTPQPRNALHMGQKCKIPHPPTPFLIRTELPFQGNNTTFIWPLCHNARSLPLELHLDCPSHAGSVEYTTAPQMCRASDHSSAGSKMCTQQPRQQQGPTGGTKYTT